MVNKDTKMLSAIMGNSERVLFESYLRPIPLTDGWSLFNLALHYSAPPARSMQGTGPKPRKCNPT